MLGLDGVRVASVATGERHTLALSADGAVYSFGHGQFSARRGALGHDDEEDQHAARRVAALEGERVTEVACGCGFSLALTDAGRAYSWGYGRRGELGHGDDEDQPPSDICADRHSVLAVVQKLRASENTEMLKKEPRTCEEGNVDMHNSESCQCNGLSCAIKLC